MTLRDHVTRASDSKQALSFCFRTRWQRACTPSYRYSCTTVQGQNLSLTHPTRKNLSLTPPRAANLPKNLSLRPGPRSS